MAAWCARGLTSLGNGGIARTNNETAAEARRPVGASCHVAVSRGAGRVVRQVRLQWLSLKRCRAVTDGSLADLAPLTRLTHLSLARCFKVRPSRLPARPAPSIGCFWHARA